MNQRYNVIFHIKKKKIVKKEKMGKKKFGWKAFKNLF